MSTEKQIKLRQRESLIQSNLCYLKKRVAEIKDDFCEDDAVFNVACFIDFKITTDKETFYVSKCLLAQKSPVFRAMFREEAKEVQDGELKLSDDTDAVRAMLLYIYENKRVDDVELAMEVIQLAHRYEIELLKLQCELFLMENIALDYAEECLTLSRRLNLGHLALKCSEVFFFEFNGFDIDRFRESHQMKKEVNKEVVIGSQSVDNLRLEDLHLRGKEEFTLLISNESSGTMKYSCAVGINTLKRDELRGGEFSAPVIDIKHQRKIYKNNSFTFYVVFTPIAYAYMNKEKLMDMAQKSSAGESSTKTAVGGTFEKKD
ncbi:unnamed protein product [Bursaphelenchus okinawaensis]|uniref:BTB domain-containing protein n=1 Tax=Bursaphelenchus okinawaensis TaxID=465554 RepID=A0A811KBE6_9BILA|nr:unnamed protein product [Bursaphelenchus okinawaensis]CAG9096624.1 unnamed protein product [Bursaphelenchus okinawaensis]